MKGSIFVIAGPSGAGKSSIVNQVVNKRPDAIENVSHTTRAMREGETCGIDYHFRSVEDFESDLKAGKFIESFKVFDNHYGTAKADLENLVAAGKNVLMVLDYQGALELKRILGNQLVTIFVTTPNEQTLERRLKSRNTDDEATINKRLKEAKKELGQAHNFEHIIVNNELERAVNALNYIIDLRTT